MTAYLAYYLAAGFAMLGWMALINRHNVREAFWFFLLWPLVLSILVASFIVVGVACAVGWRVDVLPPPAMPSGWGWRRMSDGWPGLGIRCPAFEVLVWKARK